MDWGTWPATRKTKRNRRPKAGRLSLGLHQSPTAVQRLQTTWWRSNHTFLLNRTLAGAQKFQSTLRHAVVVHGPGQLSNNSLSTAELMAKSTSLLVLCSKIFKR